VDLCRDQSRLAMLTALVPLCSIAVTPDLTDCAVKNAAVVVRVPGEFGHPANCFMQAQAFLAATSIAQELGSDDRVKIVCRAHVQAKD
jgi:hypothetical protein